MKCRATLVFTVEFDTDEPEIELEQLKKLERFEPLDVIKRAYDRVWDTQSSLVGCTLEDGVITPYVFEDVTVEDNNGQV